MKLALIILLALSGCSASLSQEQARAIDSNFAVLQKANGIIVDRLDKLEGKNGKDAGQDARVRK